LRRQSGDPESDAAVDRGRRLRLAATTAVAALLAVPLITHIALGPRDTAFYSEGSLLPVSPASVTGRVDHRWPTPSESAGWTAGPGAALTPSAGGLHVDTGTAPGQAALISAPVVLQPGRYTVLARVDIPAGGVYFRVVDDDTGQVLAVSSYAEQQTRISPIFIGNLLRLDTATRIRVEFANWVRRDRPSTFIVGSAEVRKGEHLDRATVVAPESPQGT
jgi:hypothetical protein